MGWVGRERRSFAFPYLLAVSGKARGSISRPNRDCLSKVLEIISMAAFPRSYLHNRVVASLAVPGYRVPDAPRRQITRCTESGKLEIRLLDKVDQIFLLFGSVWKADHCAVALECTLHSHLVDVES